MTNATTTTRPIIVQFTVTLTALVHPEQDVGGYSAEVPALPGCYTQGDTLDEVRTNLREAVKGGWPQPMTELLRYRPRCAVKHVSGNRMCRILEGRGWQLDRISGSHHVYSHPTSDKRVTVPVHGSADPKTWHATKHHVRRRTHGFGPMI